MIKFQTLAIIFILLVVPITLLLTYYVNSQIDIIAVQNSYDTKLLNATYDAILAFQLNSINNSGYSTNAESLRRDINASVKTFTTSLAKNHGIPGANANSLLPYVPAVLYTLYDGYYIYSPMENTTIDEEGNINTAFENTLKSYVYYTARYYTTGGQYDFVVNYSLDNYIVVYGIIDGTYCSKAGYLTYWDKYNSITLTGEADKYKTDSVAFSNWIKSNLKNIQIQDMVVEVNGSSIKTARQLTDADKDNVYYDFKGNTNKIFDIDKDNDPEVKTSTFCNHKNEIIKKSIQSNLNMAINNYTKQSEGMGTTYDFKMPILSPTEWEKILSNVSITSFMQGLQIGYKTYNNYMIVSSTGNNLYVDPEELYFVASDHEETITKKYKNGNEVKDENGNVIQINRPAENASIYYHRINCPLLAGEIYDGRSYIEGYANIDFKGVSSDVLDASGEKTGEKKYEYTHQALACYECIVASKTGGITFDTKDKDIDSNGAERRRTYADNNNNNLITFVTRTNTGKDYRNVYNATKEKLKEAYYNALFKERAEQIKVSSYINKAS